MHLSNLNYMPAPPLLLLKLSMRITTTALIKLKHNYRFILQSFQINDEFLEAEAIFITFLFPGPSVISGKLQGIQ